MQSKLLLLVEEMEQFGKVSNRKYNAFGSFRISFCIALT